MPLGKKADAGDYIKDFEKSDAPQFKGKSKEKRRKMAIAAYLDSKEKKESKMKSLRDIREAANAAQRMEESKILDNMSQLPKGIEKPLKSMQQVKKDADLGGMKITHIVKNKQGNKVVAAVVSNGKKNFVYVNNKGVAPLKEAKNPAQQAAIAIAKKEKGEKPKNEEMDPTDHVKEKDGKFCVYNADGTIAKEFDNKEDADEYAIANHDKLMATKNEGKKMDSAAMKRAMDAFKKRGGKIKKVAPGKAAGYHGKDDPGQDVQGMMDRGDTKGMPRKKKVRSMR